MGTLVIEHANAMPAPTWHRLGVDEASISSCRTTLHSRARWKCSAPKGCWEMKGRSTPRSSPHGPFLPFPWPPPPLRPLAISGSNLPCARADHLPMAAQGLRDQPVACAADQGLSPVEPASVPTSAAHQVGDPASLSAAMESGGSAARPGRRPGSHPPCSRAEERGRQPWRERLQHWRSPPSPSTSSRPSRPATSPPPTCSLPGWETRRGSTSSEYAGRRAPIVLATRPGERACATVRVEGVDGAVSAAAIDVVAAPGSSLSLAIAL